MVSKYNIYKIDYLDKIDYNYYKSHYIKINLYRDYYKINSKKLNYNNNYIEIIDKLSNLNSYKFHLYF